LMKHNEMFHHLVEGDGESAGATRAFYEEYRSVMDMTAEFYLQTIETVFQEHALPRGTWVSRNRPVRPEAITKTAIMAVEGENDDISGVGQTKAALDITPKLSSKKKEHFIAPKVGHYGIFNGRRWRNVIAPEISRFIHQNDVKK
jgi:poly(3-hydroxybutyrate) depolymerase